MSESPDQPENAALPDTPALPESFPTDWTRCLVLVAHPDDPEYGMSAAVARWTAEGRSVVYVLASSGEAGIEGMEPATAGPIREEEQRRSAAIVGVDTVEFLGFPDSRIVNNAELRDAVADSIRRHRPDIVVSLFSGPEFGPDMPNQSDHMEFGEAVGVAYDDLVAAVGVDSAEGRPQMWFESAPEPTHYVDVEGFVEPAVKALAEHSEYLSVLDPQTPVLDQSRAQVERMVAPVEGLAGGHPVVGFRRMRP
ncbi:PIG-L deacetylase family protein [Dietzia sp. ANT_WB102]|uniref:PIG-L deacetylase family protein n=1 Tax=Dietzia sp. ANT_WB102 TaxID=2597345 RepID=UPI0011F048FC|nr:PIG-L family deacetylase [Dietzia sp. ANT_WB102]KAA0918612.1 PIG-L family deacetylase [Dietzia sp. ANT_WB102]